MSYFRRVTSLLAPGFTPEPWDKVVINNRLMVWHDDDWAQSGASGLWVPERFRCGTVKAVYDAEVAYNAAPNTTWSWSDNGTSAQHSVGGGATIFDGTGSAGADDAEIQMSPASLGSALLIHLKIKINSGTATQAVQLYVDTGSGGKILIVYFTYGAAGDIRFSADCNSDYSAGTDTIEYQIVLDTDNVCAEMYLYDTQELIMAASTDTLSNGASELIRLGNWDNNAAQFTLDGDRAVVVIEGV